jgi:thymidylate kinase
MKNFPFVVFEGISYAGKTTVSNLCKNKGFSVLKGLTVLDELSKFSTFPEIPKENDEIEIVDKWFYNQHANRTAEILKVTQNNSLILDRYFLSDLAYIYARYHTYNVGNLDFYQTLLMEGINKREIIVPWFIYVSIDINLYNSRKLVDEANLKATGGTNIRIRFPYSFNKELFIENQILFYSSFFNKNRDKVFIINGSLDSEYLCEQVLEIIRQLPQSLPNQTLNL